MNKSREELVQLCDELGPEAFREQYGKQYTRTRIGGVITTVKALRLKRFAESLASSDLSRADQLKKLIEEGDTSPTNALRLLDAAAKRLKVAA